MAYRLNINRMMKAKIIFFSIVAVLVIAAVWWLYVKISQTFVSYDVQEGIDDTPTVVTRVREIGQWEFLAVNDEELIDTVRKGFFSDDELVRIYYGTLRLGIDFSQCTDEWVIREGDSIRIDLPQVKLLDENFLDEARTKSFFEKGKWTNADRQAMAGRARAAMRRRCLTQENMDRAQHNAEQEINRFVKIITKR